MNRSDHILAQLAEVQERRCLLRVSVSLNSAFSAVSDAMLPLGIPKVFRIGLMDAQNERCHTAHKNSEGHQDRRPIVAGANICRSPVVLGL